MHKVIQSCLAFVMVPLVLVIWAVAIVILAPVILLLFLAVRVWDAIRPGVEGKQG